MKMNEKNNQLLR